MKTRIHEAEDDGSIAAAVREKRSDQLTSRPEMKEEGFSPLGEKGRRIKPSTLSPDFRVDSSLSPRETPSIHPTRGRSD